MKPVPPVHEGLAGVVIAQTEICAVDGERGTLSYRGYDIGELACHATFEETVYLLWHGELPSREELDAFSTSLAADRDIDDTIWRILTILPQTVDPMDALRTTVSALSCSDDDRGDRCLACNLEKGRHLVAKFPTIVANYYSYQNGNGRVRPNPDLGHAANFLYMIHGKVPTEMQARSMDMAMLLMADHGFNASTFAARVTAATLSDMYAAITTAIGTLNGPLHGGANRRAMQMILQIGDVDNVESYITGALARKERIMGFGHRVYKTAPDPRSAYLRGRLYELCAELGDFHFYELATAIAETVEAKKGLYPNVDFYAAPLLYLLGIPLELFVPVFAISRIPGWTAQVMEQYARNRLIRPLAAYVGPDGRTYRPISDR
ncbi:MAG: citrate synthase [Anaerolineae bacterium]|nr:citrate synthase [Anaerolineae bacterium]